MSNENTHVDPEAALKETARLFNAGGAGGETDNAELAARAAASKVNGLQGSAGHDGAGAVREDTPEELAELAAKKAKEAEEAAKDEGAGNGEQAAEAEPETTAEPDPAPEATEWVQSTSKEFNAALGMMKAAGMTPAEAQAVFAEAIKTGDVSKADTAALTAKVGEDQAALIMAGFTSYVSGEGQKVLERRKAVHDEVGGIESWNTMTTWAKGKAAGDEAFKAEMIEITQLMNGDSPMAAKLAAARFKSMYEADSGNSTLKTSKVTDPSAAPVGNPKPSATPITAKDYAEAVDKAQRTLRGQALATEMAKLSRDRAAGRRAGY